jgi:hypothetical protein
MHMCAPGLLFGHRDTWSFKLISERRDQSSIVTQRCLLTTPVAQVHLQVTTEVCCCPVLFVCCHLQLSTLQPTDSFVHLHAVVDWPGDEAHPTSSSSKNCLGATAQLPVHTYFLAPELVGDTGWPTLTISTAVDDTLAPPGKQVQWLGGRLG